VASVLLGVIASSTASALPSQRWIAVSDAPFPASIAA
jgi:hypothetical protein